MNKKSKPKLTIEERVTRIEKRLSQSVKVKDFVFLINEVEKAQAVIDEIKRAFPHIRFGGKNESSV